MTENPKHIRINSSLLMGWLPTGTSLHFSGQISFMDLHELYLPPSQILGHGAPGSFTVSEEFVGPQTNPSSKIILLQSNLRSSPLNINEKNTPFVFSPTRWIIYLNDHHSFLVFSLPSWSLLFAEKVDQPQKINSRGGSEKDGLRIRFLALRKQYVAGFW